MKNKYIVFLVLAFIAMTGIAGYGDEESVIALPGHELGDQVFSLRAGVILPLFFHDFEEYKVYSANSTIGATGAIQWNFYLTSYLRLGLDIGLAFNLDVNANLYNMIPITAKVTYVISVSRFEFPISLSTGLNVLNYQDIYDLSFIIRPGVAGYWRFNANLSFGVEIAYWWLVEFPAGDNPAVAGNFLDISPSLFYHF